MKALLKSTASAARRHFAGVAVVALAFAQVSSAEIAVKNGEKIAFLGDSITAGGWGNPLGYVRLVMAGLEANGVKAEAVPAGISGHKSDNMLARLDRDVLSKKPQWMTLSCGVNDVWHGKNGVALDETALAAGDYGTAGAARGTYQKNMAAIVQKAEAAGIKVVLLTATVIQEKLDNAENAKLAPYNDYLRRLAREKNLRLADLNAMFQERIKAENKPNQKVLTSDGVHMAREGDKLMATGVLQALGLDAEQLKTAQAAWTKVEANVKAAKEAAAQKAAAKATAAKGVPLFNGTNTDGWHLRRKDGHNSWTVEPGGVLNNTVKTGEHGTDLVTDKKYWNFTVKYEFMVPDDSNSGFYLRGRHEIQILGDFKTGKTAKGGNGAIYNHTAPSVFASKPGHEWQTIEATIIGNKITVILNGKKIHDAVECNVATGSEIDKKVTEPGPIFLQGDHGTVSFRNMTIQELAKE